ncbi:MAG: hypothetical protein RL519_1204 [Pseudomonadota bacterium]|jgi:hypothetical protein
MKAARTAIRRRGQPLAVLGGLLLGWVGLRAALWERIELPGLPPPVVAAVAKVLPKPPRQLTTQLPSAPLAQRASFTPQAAPFANLPPPLAPAPGWVDLAPVPEFGTAGEGFGGSRAAAAHQLAWMAGVAQLPVPRFIIDRFSQQADSTSSLIPAEARHLLGAGSGGGRWSGDGWVLLRTGGAGVTASGLPSPSYGASQAGAVIRYRLSAGSSRSPSLFLRASSALRSPRGEEVALGVSARPLAALPIAFQGELRATRQTLGTTLRPAFGMVTELPRLPLAGGLSTEVYAQAGYVGGAGATAFVDGQVRIERHLARIGRGELRLGLGGWGGAQKDANRLDLGPTATLDFPIGSVQGRLSADWRLRAAGNAAPNTGPAITLSAGF